MAQYGNIEILLGSHAERRFLGPIKAPSNLLTLSGYRPRPHTLNTRGFDGETNAQ